MILPSGDGERASVVCPRTSRASRSTQAQTRPRGAARPPARRRCDLIVAAAAAVDRATDQFQRHYNQRGPTAVRAAAAGRALARTIPAQVSFFFFFSWAIYYGPFVRVSSFEWFFFFFFKYYSREKTSVESDVCSQDEPCDKNKTTTRNRSKNVRSTQQVSWLDRCKSNFLK